MHCDVQSGAREETCSNEPDKQESVAKGEKPPARRDGGEPAAPSDRFSSCFLSEGCG